jgi:hypothetical protein
MGKEKRMEVENIEKEKGSGDKKGEETYRISISKVAEKAVVDVMERVNQGFTAGQVNRSQLASWILVRYAETANADEIRAIRMDHVNEIALLEHYYREAKESGKLQPEVRDLIRKLAGVDDMQRKGSRKGLKNVINDDIRESEDGG